MRALVTGATGLVGGCLAQCLPEEGYEVRALVRRSSDTTHLQSTKAEIVYGDVSDYDSLPPALEGVQMVFHSASKVTPGWGPWEDFEKTIVKGTQNLLQAASESGVQRFLHISSNSVLGKSCLCDTPADEDTPCQLTFDKDHYYEYAKLMAEQAVLEYHEQGKIKATIIRPAMVYGPGDRLLTDRIYRHMSNRFIIWPGKSNPICAPVFVSDVAECAILAATSEKALGQIYHVAPGRPVYFKELCANMIKALGGWRIQLTVPYGTAILGCFLMEGWAKLIRAKNMPYLTRSSVRFLNEGMNIDGSKARTELGWKQKVSMEEGCKMYVAWRRAREGKSRKVTVPAQSKTTADTSTPR